MDAALAGIRQLARLAAAGRPADQICGAVQQQLATDGAFAAACEQLCSPGVPGCCKDADRAEQLLERATALARDSAWGAAQAELTACLRWAPAGLWDRAALLRATCLLAQVLPAQLHGQGCSACGAPTRMHAQGCAGAAREDCQQAGGGSGSSAGAAVLRLAACYLAEGALPQALHCALQAQQQLPACSDVRHLVHRLQLTCRAAVAPAEPRQARLCTAQDLAALHVRSIPGEGRALHAAQPIQAGTDVLREPPVCLAVAGAWASRVSHMQARRGAALACMQAPEAACCAGVRPLLHQPGP